MRGIFHVLYSACVAVVVGSVVVACGQAPAPAGHDASTQQGGSSRPSAAAGRSSAAAPSAVGQLGAFIAAAQYADGQIRHAAVLVNGDITTTSMHFTLATLAAVQALSNAPVARAIPAGLPADLLRDVLVVYGDLSSRSAAFGGVRIYGSSGQVLPAGSPAAQEVQRGLRNGSPAAASFDGDLAAVRALAGGTPPVTIAPPDSQAAAELALRLNSIDRHNVCSAAFGGWLPAALENISWRPGADTSTHYEGTISGTRFQADYAEAGGWAITIFAC